MQGLDGISLSGQKGRAGEKGNLGLRGDEGLQGFQGEKGVPGRAGNRGETGLKLIQIAQHIGNSRLLSLFFC